MRVFLTFLFALIATPALADPVTIAVAAISATATVGTAALFAATWWSAFATTLALSQAARMLAPDPDDFSNAVTGYAVSGTAPAADHQIIYGRQRVGGIVVFKETTNDNKDLHIVIALAGHEVQEIESIYLNDEEVTFDAPLSTTLAQSIAPEHYAEKTHVETEYDDDGNVESTETVVDQEAAVYCAAFLGSDTQAASSELIAASDNKWTGNHRLQGVAYIYVKLKFVPDAFPNGEPTITAVVKGKKVYNPNTDTTEYSENAALCLRDYLTSDYGMKADTDEIDDTSFIAAQNICDEDVTLSAGGTEKRYLLNASFTTGTEPQKIIDQMVLSMAGSMWYAQGKFRVKAGAYVTPTITLDEDDLRSNMQIQSRRSRRENFNTVVGTFRGAETNWFKSDYPKVTSSSFVSVDGGDEVTSNIDLPYTPTNTMAQRIAKILLYRNREQIVVNGSFGLKAFQLQVGDTVKLTNTRAGWDEKVFEVLAWTFEPNGAQMLEVKMTLQEISSTVYDWDADEDAFESNNTALADAFVVPTVGINLSTATRIIQEHVVNALIVTTSVSDQSRLDYVVVEYKPVGTDNYIQMGQGELGVFEAIDVETGFYQVRARGVNSFGIKGEFTSDIINVQGLIEPPDNVASITAEVNGGLTFLEWEPVSNLDLSYYRIRHAVETSGASFADATDSAVRVARPATSITVPARSGTYLIRAYDKLGIPSAADTSVSVVDGQLEPFTNEIEVSEHTAFSGTKTGCSVSSGVLSITDASSAPSTATYVFSNEIDTSSVRRVRATGHVKVSRGALGNQFDDLVGYLDTLAGNFDSLTIDPQEPDHNVETYIRTTDDNPSGSPTWSDWRKFKSGDFSGRAFQFKIELHSSADGVTPQVAELKAKVEYN